MHKSGFVNIVGNPNVGKSTLMNSLVGERLSIITSKSQTTRHRIMGIVSGEDFQIVYSDTPGVIKPAYKLQESMLSYSIGALSDADIVLYVTDTVEKVDKNLEFIEQVRRCGARTIVVLNKIDLCDISVLEGMVERWGELLPDAVVLPLSAKVGFGVEQLLCHIRELLPDGEAYFAKDTLTDRSLRYFTSEIIREKILEHYDKEIPYCCEVLIEKYDEGDVLDRVSAVINVMRQSQKGILIGKGGSMLKRVSSAARRDLERFLGKKVFLEVFVKVEENWRNSIKHLREFGYEGQ